MIRLPVSAIVWFLVFLFTFPVGVKAFNLPFIPEMIVCGIAGYYAGYLMRRINEEYTK